MKTYNQLRAKKHALMVVLMLLVGVNMSWLQGPGGSESFASTKYDHGKYLTKRDTGTTATGVDPNLNPGVLIPSGDPIVSYRDETDSKSKQYDMIRTLHRVELTESVTVKQADGTFKEEKAYTYILKMRPQDLEGIHCVDCVTGRFEISSDHFQISNGWPVASFLEAISKGLATEVIADFKKQKEELEKKKKKEELAKKAMKKKKKLAEKKVAICDIVSYELEMDIEARSLYKYTEEKFEDAETKRQCKLDNFVAMDRSDDGYYDLLNDLGQMLPAFMFSNDQDTAREIYAALSSNAPDPFFHSHLREFTSWKYAVQDLSVRYSRARTSWERMSIKNQIDRLNMQAQSQFGNDPWTGLPGASSNNPWRDDLTQAVSSLSQDPRRISQMMRRPPGRSMFLSPFQDADLGISFNASTDDVFNPRDSGSFCHGGFDRSQCIDGMISAGSGRRAPSRGNSRLVYFRTGPTLDEWQTGNTSNQFNPGYQNQFNRNGGRNHNSQRNNNTILQRRQGRI